MLFEMSMKNIRKSYKDYAIYFLTLILGVAIFYVFNSIDSQQAMLALTESSRDIIKLMVSLLSGVSVGVSIILGFLIIYANGFLIRRRKKEFGIYMTLGMSKQSISRILLGETLIIGFISLVIGLSIGIFVSQFMSILIGKMFEADMEQYRFVFSREATIKTILYFGIMFVLVILFNVIAIGKCKLIDLISASRKNQQIKLKHPVLSVIVFLISIGMLSYSYYSVTSDYLNLSNVKCLIVIVIGSVATYLFFWSLSGFFLVVTKRAKNFYLRGLNAFVLKQINSKINTMVFTMTIICLMLFLSIGAISTGMSLKESCNADIKNGAPVDISINKTVSEKEPSTIEEVLRDSGFDLKQLKKGYVEIPQYASCQLTMGDLLGAKSIEELTKQFPLVKWDTPADIFLESDYNRLAALYGRETYTLEDDEYVAVCTFKNIEGYQNDSLKAGVELTVDGKTFHPKYTNCKDGMIILGNQTFNVVVLPDSAFENRETLAVSSHVLAADYNGSSKEELAAIEKNVDSLKPDKKYEELNAISKIKLTESNTGIAAIVTFVGLYIGIIFLVTSAALLALKELSETADNKERYMLLRKLGAEDTMIHHSLLMQIGIFFFMPLFLAVIHAIFGITFVNKMLVVLLDKNLMKPIILSIFIYGIIYMIYFFSTYFGSKRILED